MAPDTMVFPRDESIRKVLRHPSGRRFENWPAATPWPSDQFTARRLIEGAVTLTQAPKVEESAAVAPRRGRIKGD